MIDNENQLFKLHNYTYATYLIMKKIFIIEYIPLQVLCVLLLVY